MQKFARPAASRLPEQAGPAGELQGETLVGIIEVHAEQLGNAAQPVGHGVAVQVQPLRGPDDRSLLIEVDRERPDGDVGAGRAEAGGGGKALTGWLNAGHDAGTGPYTAQTWNKNQEFEVILKEFPKYWGGWSGPHFTKVVFRVVPQDTTAAQLLRSGQVTFIEQIAPALWSSFKGDSSVSLVSSPSWQNLLAQLNVKALSLPVRQAILYAIDYNGIVAALRGAGVLSSGIVPPGMFGHFNDLPAYSYDQARAAALLKSAGYGPGGRR
jgi:ABC-type transport system substrate-binding protein